MPVNKSILVTHSNALLTVGAFLLVCLFSAGPILLHPYLPLVDLPNHIARHYIATSGTTPLDQYYTYHFSVVPNLAVDLLWLGLGNEMDPVRFSQLSIAASIVLLIGTTMLLHRCVFKYWSPWPAAISLACYSASFYWGFQNYIFSVPFVVAAIGAWLWSEKFPLKARLSIFFPVVLALFIMHFFAFAAFAISVLGREVQRIVESGREWRNALVNAVVLAVPFVIPIVWLVFQTVNGEPSAAGSQTEFGPPYRRVEVFSSIVGLVTELGLSTPLVFLAFIILCILIFFVASLAITTIGRLTVAKELRGPIIALTIFAFITPSWLNGVAFVHFRLPLVAMAIFFAATRWTQINRHGAILVSTVVLLTLMARGVYFEQFASQHSEDIKNFTFLLEDVPGGARLLPVRASSGQMDTRLWHIAGYAVVRRDVFIPTLFQGVHALQVREEWSDYATPAFHAASAFWLQPLDIEYPTLLNFVRNWQSKFTYVVMLDDDTSELNGFAELEIVGSKDRFTLYKISEDYTE